jgi:hypothetical protein
MDMSKPRAWVEHDEHGKRMIYLDEREDYLKKGWFRPGKKPEKTEVIEEETEEKKANLNDASELSDFLNETFGLKTNHRQGLRRLREIYDDCNKDNQSGSTESND